MPRDYFCRGTSNELVNYHRSLEILIISMFINTPPKFNNPGVDAYF